MKPAKPLPMSGQERKTFGCILTFENAAGRREVVHAEGARIEGLRRACAHMLALDPTFKLLSYSTPETIYTDLQGRRVNQAKSTDIGGETGDIGVMFPEPALLDRAGYRQMLHRSLWGSYQERR